MSRFSKIINELCIRDNLLICQFDIWAVEVHSHFLYYNFIIERACQQQNHIDYVRKYGPVLYFMCWKKQTLALFIPSKQELFGIVFDFPLRNYLIPKWFNQIIRLGVICIAAAQQETLDALTHARAQSIRMLANNCWQFEMLLGDTLDTLSTLQYKMPINKWHKRFRYNQ